jgi:hypothetical protein
MHPPKQPAESDGGMRRLYVLVVVCEALVITALWAFERMFS